MTPHGKRREPIDWEAVGKQLEGVPLDGLTHNLGVAIFANSCLLRVAARYSANDLKSQVTETYAAHKERLDAAMNLIFEDVNPDWFELTLAEAFGRKA